VAYTVDSKTMSLQYFETLKVLGSSLSGKFNFLMEYTSMLSSFLGMGGNPRKNSGGNTDSQS
jgi:hypothetical protein